MPSKNTTLTSALNLMGLKEAATELGVSIEPLLQRYNIAPSLLQSFDGFLPSNSIVELLEAAATEFACPYFGLLVVKHRPSLAFGVITQLVKASPDVGTAIENAHRRVSVFSQSSLWETRTDANTDTASIIRANRRPYSGSSAQAEALGIGSHFKLLAALMEPGWHPNSISLTRPAPSPSAIKYHRQFFEAPVYFDQERDCINLKARDLQKTLPTSDPELLSIIEQHIATLETPVDEDICSQVNQVIRQLLDTGNCSMELVAGKLGLHRKSLQRALQAENTTFKALLSEARMQVAEFYLKNSQIELIQLADILGYSCPSALSRSFKKQHGISPQRWRQALQ